MDYVLEVKELVKHFPVAGQRSKVMAVNGVDFQLAKGETLSLVGESGSGKTTVGRCILGLEKPTKGFIHFRGTVIGRKINVRSKILRGKVQFVFQESAEALDPRIEIGRSIAEPLKALGVDSEERKKRVSEMIKRVGMTVENLDLYPAELSAGAQQRVCIARALVTRPELLILDEPTSALDPTSRAEIIDLLIRLQNELETAYLFISHDLNTVRYVSHRVAVMYLGMIVEQGLATEIFSRPLHPYAAGLLSSVLLPNPRIRRRTNVSLKGEIPSPVNLPLGCYLASRCPLVEERCQQHMPDSLTLDEGHIVHCFNYAKVIEIDSSLDTFDEFQCEAERILGYIGNDSSQAGIES